MMEITITLQTPELSGAIHALANALCMKPMNSIPPPYAIPQPPPGVAIIPQVQTAPPPQPQHALQRPPVPTVGTPPSPPVQAAAYAPPQPDQAAQPSAPPPPAPAPPPPPPVSEPGLPPGSPPAYSHDQLMLAGAAMLDAGRQPELTALLSLFGVPAVAMLKPEQFGAFATELRKIGAAI